MGFRNKILILIFLFTVIVLATFVSGQKSFEVSVSVTQQTNTCDTIDHDTTLTGQVNASGNCFNFILNNVVFDCAQFLIVGPGSSTAINITNKDNVTIKNCIVRDFTNSLETHTATNLLFSNNSFENRSVMFNSQARFFDSFVAAYNFSNLILSIARENNSEVNFSTAISGESAANLISVVVIRNSSIMVNSTAANHFNTSAHLTFLRNGAVDIEPSVDFQDNGIFVTCPTGLCEDAAISPRDFSYDVTHFTTFSFKPTTPQLQNKGGERNPPTIRKIPWAINIIPEYIEAYMKAGETKSFVIEIQNGPQKDSLKVSLEAPEFMFLNNNVKQFYLTLPPNEKWRILLTVSLPKDALGIYTGTIRINGNDVHKLVNISIISGSGVIFNGQKQGKQENLLETELRKIGVEKPVSLGGLQELYVNFGKNILSLNKVLLLLGTIAIIATIFAVKRSKFGK